MAAVSQATIRKVFEEYAAVRSVEGDVDYGVLKGATYWVRSGIK